MSELEPPRGFEPRTDGLRNHCSTAELRRLASARLLYGRDGDRLWAPRLAEYQVAVLRVDQDGIALMEFAVEDRHRERILDPPLDHPLQRTGPVCRVVALVGN